LRAEVRAQETRRAEVYGPPDQLGKFFLKRNEAQPNALLRQEVNEKIDVTGRIFFASRNGAEEAEPGHAKAFAELGQTGAVDGF
jgi:hypothetical protein